MVIIKLTNRYTVTIYKHTMIKDTINKPIDSMGIVYYHWGYMVMGYRIIFIVGCTLHLFTHTPKPFKQ